jgi:hypothetical protein
MMVNNDLYRLSVYQIFSRNVDSLLLPKNLQDNKLLLPKNHLGSKH